MMLLQYSALTFLASFLLNLPPVTSLHKKQLFFDYQTHYIPHPEKAHRGGQDAYYNHTRMLVIADGVGGWNNRGVDPSKYSRFLCQKAQKLLKEDEQQHLDSPLSVIENAAKANKNIGSATMQVLTLPQQNLMKYCYIGDSGFMVIRRYQQDDHYTSIFEYVEQQHGFNFPFQLALPEYGGDNPKHSICGQIELQENDIIVVGSDGLYDNVSFRQVLNKVKQSDKNGTLLTTLAKELAEIAISRGKDPKFNSPFAQRAKQQNLSYIGGKLDDTTVTIAKVVYDRPNQGEL